MGFHKIGCLRQGISNCQCPRNRVSQKLDVYFLGYIIEITDDIYDLEEFVNTITDMGIWIYSLEVGPVPITASHAEDFGC